MSTKNKLLKRVLQDANFYIILYLILVLVIANMLTLDYALGNRKELLPFLPRNQTFSDEEYHDYIGNQIIFKEMEEESITDKVVLSFRLLGLIIFIHLGLLILIFSIKLYKYYKVMIFKIDLRIGNFIKYLLYRLGTILMAFVMTFITFLYVNRRILLKLINSHEVIKTTYLKYNSCPLGLLISMGILIIVDSILFFKITKSKN